MNLSEWLMDWWIPIMILVIFGGCLTTLGFYAYNDLKELNVERKEFCNSLGMEYYRSKGDCFDPNTSMLYELIRIDDELRLVDRGCIE